MNKITFLGAGSNHGGSIISTGATKTFVKVGGTLKLIACESALHTCPIEGHGITPIVSGSNNRFAEGGKIIRVNDVAGCGASGFSPTDNSYSN